jgi:hypothetical protein
MNSGDWRQSVGKDDDSFQHEEKREKMRRKKRTYLETECWKG